MHGGARGVEVDVAEGGGETAGSPADDKRGLHRQPVDDADQHCCDEGSANEHGGQDDARSRVVNGAINSRHVSLRGVCEEHLLAISILLNYSEVNQDYTLFG